MSSKPRFVGEKVKLGDVCDVLNGFAFKSRQYVDKGIRIIRIANVQKGYLEDSKPCFYPVKLTDSLKQYILEENDLLVSLTGNVGRVALLEKSFLPAALNQRVACLRIKDESRICKRYLYHALNSSLFENNCVESANGIAQKNMSTTWLKGYRIPAPSMVEQEIIIKQLDLIQRQISNVKRQLSEFDSLVKSRFVEMFGDPVDGVLWAKQKLSDLYQVKSSKRIYAREQTKSGVPFLRLADVGSLIDSGMADSGLFISEERFEELKVRGQVPAPDDVLVTARGTLGRCYVIKPADHFYFQDGMITWLAASENSPLPSYLLAIFDNPHFIEQLSNNCSGTTVRYLSISDLANVTIPVAPLALQEEFAAFASQVDKSRFIAQQQIEKLQMLYDSLAQDYFGD